MGPRRVSLTRSWSVKEYLGDNLPTIESAGRARARAGRIARVVGGTWQPWRCGGAFDSLESGPRSGTRKPGTSGVADAAGECVWGAAAGYVGSRGEYAGRVDRCDSGGAGGAGERRGRSNRLA